MDKHEKIIEYMLCECICFKETATTYSYTYVHTLSLHDALPIFSGPSLSIDKPDAALDEARTKAVAKSRARAELYARASHWSYEAERPLSRRQGDRKSTRLNSSH